MSKKYNVDELTSGKRVYEQPSVGVQEARILRVIDMGLRKPDERFKDPKAKKPQQPKEQFLFILELADDKTEFDGKKIPMLAFHYVNKAGKKPSGEHSKFTSIIEAASLDKEFDLHDFLGKAVSVTLGRKDDKSDKVKVTNVSGLSARVADTVPDLVGDSYVLDFDSPDPKVVEKLSDNMRGRLAEALNFPGSKLEELINSVPKEDTQEQAPDDSTEAPF